jgi:cell division protein FtsI/penicillin-binding protein 2
MAFFCYVFFIAKRLRMEIYNTDHSRLNEVRARCSKMKNIIFKRQVRMLFIFSILFILLVSRLAYIQLIGTESFSAHDVNLIKKSVQQRQQQIVLHTGRGEITDRFGQSLTGMSTYVMVLFPLSKKARLEEEKIVQVANLLDLSAERILERIKELKEPEIYQTGPGILHLTEEEANQLNHLEIPGILGLPYEQRYDEKNMVAQHLIGYVGQNPAYIRQKYAEELAQGALTENSVIGISGLEKTFQPFLQGVGPTSLSYYVDAKGYPLQGMEIKYTGQENSFYPLTVQTTLDMELQDALEQMMDNRFVHEGTVVVLDAETSEILAMSSRPNFVEQMRVVGSWENKALKRYTPGSIFKIVVAAAALEQEIVTPNQRFQCNGVLEGTDFHCWKKEGHGSITFEEGFAQSCNIVFGQVAQQLGPDMIEEYASKLGLLDQNGWHEDFLYHLENFKQLDSEDQGQIYSSHRTTQEREDKLYLLQTGIGQLDVQLTPLAVANMLATITKGGTKHQVKSVRDILYQTGGAFYHFDHKKIEGPQISPYTAYQLQKMLASVVEEGTAQQLKDKSWDAAGKTGTAQVIKWNDHLQAGQNGNKLMLNHRWFAGYYPQHHPRFVIVTLALNQSPNARNVSIDLFGDVVDWLDKNR